MFIRRNSKGFTLVEIMIVVAIIGLLAAIAVPNFVQARNSARSSTCINNLRLIDSAKEQYAIENNIASGTATTSTDCTPYLKNNAFPVCPGTSTAYTTNAVGVFPTCALAGSASGMTPKSHRLD
ncbi:MAG TPA: prepilin-type N-terminal cleavage/methylation domain-containing protein [Candidatus Eisenbacteria bacterium]|jgi:prepilin-type N-terminal cleavage/methylation domain-containing protein|nr:prepilin-type N-terminal cleavage/methylation domain-containing protein [Candidatus Eisenbacteria bacterium]